MLQHMCLDTTGQLLDGWMLMGKTVKTGQGRSVATTELTPKGKDGKVSSDQGRAQKRLARPYQEVQSLSQ